MTSDPRSMPGMHCGGLPVLLRGLADPNSGGFLTPAFKALAWKVHALPININEAFTEPNI